MSLLKPLPKKKKTQGKEGKILDECSLVLGGAIAQTERAVHVRGHRRDNERMA
jgi:hypothetical protein